MKTRTLVLSWFVIVAVILAAQTVSALPRSPMPPVPEQNAIWHESFDEDYFWGETNVMLAIQGFGMLNESWSG
jgi:hypothetical protein